jgi:hypothetical protein
MHLQFSPWNWEYTASMRIQGLQSGCFEVCWRQKQANSLESLKETLYFKTEKAANMYQGKEGIISFVYLSYLSRGSDTLSKRLISSFSKYIGTDYAISFLYRISDTLWWKSCEIFAQSLDDSNARSNIILEPSAITKSSKVS